MLALLFPGQGSQEVGMGRTAALHSDAARAVFETADAVLGFSLSKLCFEGPEEELRRTEVQQPAVLATSIALLRALEERVAVEPVCVLGHSLGEYSALVAADALSLEDALPLVHLRGRFMQEAVPEGRGAMAAVLGLDAAQVEEACAAARSEGGVVSPANYNSPQQTVIAGDADAVERAGAEAKRRGAKRVTPLPVSAPFHCQLMAPAAEKLVPELRRIGFRTPGVPVVHNVDAEASTDAEAIAGRLERQVTAPVRFTDCVSRLAGLGVTRVIEVGPGRVLSGLTARIDRSLERAGVSDMEGIVELSQSMGTNGGAAATFGSARNEGES